MPRHFLKDFEESRPVNEPCSGMPATMLERAGASWRRDGRQRTADSGQRNGGAGQLPKGEGEGVGEGEMERESERRYHASIERVD